MSTSLFSGSRDTHGRYAINYRAIMYMHRIGGGSINLQMLAGLMLGMPSRRIPYMFRKCEDLLGPFLQEVAQQSMEEGQKSERNAEISNTMDEPIVDGNGRVGISVGCDMHWPRRSGGGKKYVSPSGCSYMMVSKTAYILGFVVFANSCRTCLYHERKSKEVGAATGPVQPHRCPKNYPPSKSPKTMEAAATLQLITEISRGEGGIFVRELVIDDDTSTPAIL